MPFQLPTAEQISQALGDIGELPKSMQMAVSHRLEESFSPVPQPRHNDWLHNHQERGQTVKTFRNNNFKAVPHSTYRTIYIQPFGSFDHPRAAPMELISQFTRTFFSGCEVELLPTENFTEQMKHRINDFTRQIQYRTDGFYNHLSQTRQQRDARKELLTVAVTMADIYPDEQWNFVYGQARATDGLGVYSFSRLDPLFPKSPEKLLSIPLTNEHRTIILRRSVKILLHEIGHLFGLAHCIYYICLMNGANHEGEMDRQPLYLCPVCLRKLHSTLNFDVITVYEQFINLCEQNGLLEERDWYKHRLDCIRGDNCDREKRDASQK